MQTPSLSCAETKAIVYKKEATQNFEVIKLFQLDILIKQEN